MLAFYRSLYEDIETFVFEITHLVDDGFGRMRSLVRSLSLQTVSKKKCLSFSELKCCQHWRRFMRQCLNTS